MIRNDRISEWAAWGRPEDAPSLADRPALLAYLNEELGKLDVPVPPLPLELVKVPTSRLSPAARQALLDAVGGDRVDDSASGRAAHSVGKSYRDMLAACSGRLACTTDAVVYPGDEPDVLAVLTAASDHDLAVVPFGGGSSVVGGVEPRCGKHHAAITLDLMDLNGVALDATSQLAEIGAGAFGPDIERALAAQGYTLGHFPQSFEFSTFGGWVATRGAGQQSTAYGKIEDIVQAVRIATPRGVIATRCVPASATGPSVLQQIVGSEGTLGVITSGTARVRPLPDRRRFRAWFLPDWSRAVSFVRDLLQAGVRPAVVRLSDPEETRWLLKTASQTGGLIRRIGKTYIRHAIRARRFDPDQICLCLLGFEGPADGVRLACRSAAQVAGRYRAVGLGSAPGRSWERDRFTLPYLRDDLMARGVMVDTLETATTWRNLERLDRAVRDAITAATQASGSRGTVMAHVSHVYATGASLYYTFLARRQTGHEMDQWQAIKTAATQAIIDHDGTLSHHHGIGYEHLPLAAEHGPLAVEGLQALKAAFDPDGLMNPEKLI